jgi:hypothetical protein
LQIHKTGPFNWPSKQIGFTQTILASILSLSRAAQFYELISFKAGGVAVKGFFWHLKPFLA